MTRLALSLLCTLLAGIAGAHEVRHDVATTGAVLVRLSYADGSPFAFEAYEATPEGADKPAHVGRTDAQGNALFLPGASRRWRLKAWSADGHGVDIRFEAPANGVATPATMSTDEGPNRASMTLFGLSLILGGFGGLQLFRRNR